MVDHAMSRFSNSSHTEKTRRLPIGRIAALVLLAVVLTLAFIGHLTPSMRVQWANFMALCGF